MPLLFLAHGSPMNAIANNVFTKTLNLLSKNLPTPSAILCISAHWQTEGTWITHSTNPKTIHDFGGFPPELYKIQYPAPGDPQLAEKIQKMIESPQIKFDDKNWGFDHGSWSVLLHLYPEAKIPVIQLSMDMTQPPQFHFDLGRQLNFLRAQGVLIVASGNIVHNLRTIQWEEKTKPLDWAIEFDQWVKQNLLNRNFNPLISDFTKSKVGHLSVPTPDHYYPLLYILGATEQSDELKFEFEGFQNASISMRSIRFG